jgi:hypothetical protein
VPSDSRRQQKMLCAECSGRGAALGRQLRFDIAQRGEAYYVGRARACSCPFMRCAALPGAGWVLLVAVENVSEAAGVCGPAVFI